MDLDGQFSTPDAQGVAIRDWGVGLDADPVQVRAVRAAEVPHSDVTTRSHQRTVPATDAAVCERDVAHGSVSAQHYDVALCEADIDLMLAVQDEPELRSGLLSRIRAEASPTVFDVHSGTLEFLIG